MLVGTTIGTFVRLAVAKFVSFDINCNDKVFHENGPVHHEGGALLMNGPQSK